MVLLLFTSKEHFWQATCSCMQMVYKSRSSLTWRGEKKARTRFMRKTAELFPCGWESPCGHTFQARLFLLRLEPRCDNDLHGQGTSHNLKENNSFPSFPNRGENTACKIRELNICFDAELFCFAWNCNRSLSSVLIKLWQSGKSHFPVPWEELFYTSHPISD